MSNDQDNSGMTLEERQVKALEEIARSLRQIASNGADSVAWLAQIARKKD
jgi:hypothetical protein